VVETWTFAKVQNGIPFAIDVAILKYSSAFRTFGNLSQVVMRKKSLVRRPRFWTLLKEDAGGRRNNYKCKNNVAALSWFLRGIYSNILHLAVSHEVMRL
jgi:hypothetical protein